MAAVERALPYLKGCLLFVAIQIAAGLLVLGFVVAIHLI
jgi:hypothetical protein